MGVVGRAGEVRGRKMIMPDLKNPFGEKYEGDVCISGENFQLLGMIVGNVTVVDGGSFVCNGMVTRNVYVDGTSSASIYGMVNGHVTGYGSIEILGMVNNEP